MESTEANLPKTTFKNHILSKIRTRCTLHSTVTLYTGKIDPCGLPLATCRVLSQRSCHQDDHQLKRGVAALSISLSLFFVLQTSYDSDMSKGNRKCILVVGSCGLDRLLTVQRFPVPDSKVRTTSYNEVGGGTSTKRSSR